MSQFLAELRSPAPCILAKSPCIYPICREETGSRSTATATTQSTDLVPWGDLRRWPAIGGLFCCQLAVSLFLSSPEPELRHRSPRAKIPFLAHNFARRPTRLPSGVVIRN